MEIIVISTAAFLVAILTFFSGFGLGTILTPVLMIFFPVEQAITITGIVHLFNNVFKLLLVGKHADKNVLLRFGIPAVLTALLGAWLLLYVQHWEPLFSYTAWDKVIEVFPVKLIIAVFLIFFALVDLIPYFNTIQFGKEKLPLGGALSGFFGGLTGSQGALRSAFLIKAGLSKEAFIGTAVVVSTFVDITRLSVYTTGLSKTAISENLTLIICATVAGMAGAFTGHKLLKKVTLRSLQMLVAIMLILISIALGAGLI
ncbi:MAG TPA: sulfite exporter TauE/SafE family protein [Ferruginibacter sp.]|nr:hypothetical protein [Chitinophagaceae bacterium]HML57622.1 sulfite exporter TauE/SafE family protein [Ferruginibacter sp.]HRN92255.1 sulfite exporter TauE/SafE family protein [Ferruginibacter sp.]HRO06011.1 sulfite exporter TauE/SafE family protein [Ferruginibacter sp.]HRO97031.1 sulfite exporter TauE/SafE family protein [Ferruginibacter sp.]